MAFVPRWTLEVMQFLVGSLQCTVHKLGGPTIVDGPGFLNLLTSSVSSSFKVGRNDTCPCGSGKKYKLCCEGTLDWEALHRARGDWRPHLSIRGRNLHFINRVFAALQFDTSKPFDLPKYKQAFTAEAVRSIHEAVMDAWPPYLDIASVLRRNSSDVSGLYVGDYGPEYLMRGLVRQSIYASKMLVVDPFTYPRSVRDEFNPILNPQKFRAQTLKNINFWLALVPWINEGLVEVIRTPADFDRRLNWESMKRQQEKFENNEDLKKAAKQTVADMEGRHREAMALETLILGAPDDHLERLVKKLGLETGKFSAKDFIRYVQAQRDRNPNVLGAMGWGEEEAQYHIMTSGASYDIARMTASLTRSHLVTDLYSKWKEIEIDRQNINTESQLWSPFAKALQNSPLKYLNNLRMEHALLLRQEGRLESMRTFLRTVWDRARTETPFTEANAQLLADQLLDEVGKAESEWAKIDQDLVKWVSREFAAGIMAAGPLIATGNGYFVAAAVVLAGGANLAMAASQRRNFPDRFPAAFFMNIKDGSMEFGQ